MSHIRLQTLVGRDLASVGPWLIVHGHAALLFLEKRKEQRTHIRDEYKE